MPIIYNLPFVVLASLLFATIATTTIFLIRRKSAKYSLIMLLLVFQLSCALSIPLMNALGYRIQSLIAAPYVQQSLVEQCLQTNVSVDPNGLLVSSGYSWISPNNQTTCYYNQVKWICTC
jgi:hypothetical protein